jgi:hypothetical protein
MIICLMVTGCQTINSYVEDWPELKITFHESYLLEINQKCRPFLTTFEKLMGSLVFGCTIYDLDKKNCDIYIAPNTPDFITQHELAHCKGGDHPDGKLEKRYKLWLDARNKVRNIYDEIPPKLLIDSNGVLHWDHSSKFGAVPIELLSIAQELCKQLDTGNELKHKAIGYHPMAQGLNGKSFRDGGYFCALK